MMNHAEVARLKKLIAKVPDEEWRQSIEEVNGECGELLPWVETEDGEDVCCTNYRNDSPNELVIAEFIAESRTALPAALETIEEQRRRIELYLDALTIDRWPPFNETVDGRLNRRERLQPLEKALEECLK